MLPPAQAPLDGVDFSNGDPEAVAEHTMEIQEEQRRNASTAAPSLEATQEEQAAADNRDWMLRDYTARLKQAGMAQTADSDPTTFTQPSNSSTTTTSSTDSNADPLIAALTPPKAPTPPPTDIDAKSEISVTELPSTSSLTSLQPLLPPLDSPALKAPRDAWGTATVPAADVDIVLSAPTPSPGETNGTSSSLDVPGLTAAESGLGPVANDVSLQDPLPDESDQQRKLDNQNNFLAPTAPTSDVAEFFKKQSEGMQAPNAPTVAQPLSAPTIVVQPPRPEEPMAKPAVSGLRSHVADPFDILRQ